MNMFSKLVVGIGSVLICAVVADMNKGCPVISEIFSFLSAMFGGLSLVFIAFPPSDDEIIEGEIK